MRVVVALSVLSALVAGLGRFPGRQLPDQLPVTSFSQPVTDGCDKPGSSNVMLSYRSPCPPVERWRKGPQEPRPVRGRCTVAQQHWDRICADAWTVNEHFNRTSRAREERLRGWVLAAHAPIVRDCGLPELADNSSIRDCRMCSLTLHPQASVGVQVTCFECKPPDFEQECIPSNKSKNFRVSRTFFDGIGYALWERKHKLKKNADENSPGPPKTKYGRAYTPPHKLPGGH